MKNQIQQQWKKMGFYFTHVGLMLTDRCNIQCRHCALNCQKHSTYDLDWALVKRIINESKEFDDILGFSFTGGEPFLRYHILKNAIDLCSVNKLTTAVVSNAFWATSVDKAKKILSKIQSLGHLAISTDSFHQEFLSIKNVQNAISACNQLGIECSVLVSYLEGEQELEIQKISRNLSDYEGCYVISSQPVQFTGRAVTEIDQHTICRYQTEKFHCSSINNPIIRSDGNAYACCGAHVLHPESHPLFLGNIHNLSLAEIRHNAEINPIIHLLRIWGPFKLMHYFEGTGKTSSVPNFQIPSENFIGICSICNYFLNHQELLDNLNQNLNNRDIFHQIATYRLFKYGEITMGLEEIEQKLT